MFQSIYDKYLEASNLAGNFVDETHNVNNLDPYSPEGTVGEVRHVVGSAKAKDALQDLMSNYITPGSNLAENLTYGLGMAKTYGEEIADAWKIGKGAIKAGDWDKILGGDFLTQPLEDIRFNRIGLSIPYGATTEEQLSYAPSAYLFKGPAGMNNPYAGLGWYMKNKNTMPDTDFNPRIKLANKAVATNTNQGGGNQGGGNQGGGGYAAGQSASSTGTGQTGGFAGSGLTSAPPPKGPDLRNRANGGIISLWHK